MTIKTFKEFIAEGLQKLPGTQYGSNEGGIHRDTETGEKHYVKHYAHPDQAKAEVLAGKIYQHMGIHTLKPEHKKVNGKPAVVTKWRDGLKRVDPEQLKNLDSKQAHQVGRMYHAAVLTKNWDVVGADHDNILKDAKGDLHSVDAGGSFHFRAQGKPKEYGPDIEEHKSLKAHNQVFNHTFKQHPDAEREGLKAVKNLDDKKIHSEFKNSGLSNWKELHSNFTARKKALLAKYE